MRNSPRAANRRLLGRTHCPVLLARRNAYDSRRLRNPVRPSAAGHRAVGRCSPRCEAGGHAPAAWFALPPHSSGGPSANGLRHCARRRPLAPESVRARSRPSAEWPDCANCLSASDSLRPDRLRRGRGSICRWVAATLAERRAARWCARRWGRFVRRDVRSESRARRDAAQRNRLPANRRCENGWW